MDSRIQILYIHYYIFIKNIVTHSKSKIKLNYSLNQTIHRTRKNTYTLNIYLIFVEEEKSERILHCIAYISPTQITRTGDIIYVPIPFLQVRTSETIYRIYTVCFLTFMPICNCKLFLSFINH